MLWSVKGAPGEEFYPALRIPVVLMIGVGWIGLFFTVLPGLLALESRSKRTHESELEVQPEEVLAARGEAMKLRLPITLEARRSQKLVCLSIGATMGLAWSFWLADSKLIVLAAVFLVLLAFETFRVLTYRVDLRVDFFEVRNLWHNSVYGYAELEDVQAERGGNLILVLTSGKRVRCYLGHQNAEDIVLLLTTMMVADEAPQPEDRHG